MDYMLKPSCAAIIIIAAIAAGCVQPNAAPSPAPVVATLPATAAPAPATAPTVTPLPSPKTLLPAPTPQANPRCVLTNFRKIATGDSVCELAGTYPGSPDAGKSAPCCLAPGYTYEYNGPAPTGHVLTCTGGGLERQECGQWIKVQWGFDTCSRMRAWCAGPYSAYGEIKDNPAQARCATCEDLCQGTCSGGACHPRQPPGTEAQMVDCRTLEPLK